MTQQQYERSKIAIESEILLKGAKVTPERYGNEVSAVVSSPAGRIILDSFAEVTSFLAGVRFGNQPIEVRKRNPFSVRIGRGRADHQSTLDPFPVNSS